MRFTYVRAGISVTVCVYAYLSVAVHLFVCVCVCVRRKRRRYVVQLVADSSAGNKPINDNIHRPLLLLLLLLLMMMMMKMMTRLCNVTLSSVDRHTCTATGVS